MEQNANIAVHSSESSPNPQSVGEVAPVKKLPKWHGLLGMPSAAAAETVGILFAMGSASVAAYNTVRINFYRNMDKHGVFEDIKKKRIDTHTELLEEYKGKKNSKELVSKLLEVEKEYTTQVDKLFKGYGINNVLDRWKTLKYHQKNEVYLAFGAVSAILLGVVAGTSTTRRVEENQEELEKRLDELHAKLDRHNNNTVSR